jgi:hypothetical protein
METVGLFRTRVSRDGAVEVWAKGWRLGSQAPAAIPVVFVIGFLISGFGTGVKVAACVLLLGCAWLTYRLSRIGFLVDDLGITVRRTMRSHRIEWDRFEGIVGERNEHEGRCTIVTTDGRRVSSPGTLDPDEMDPYWGEGEVAAVDELNRLIARLRRAFTTGAEHGDTSDPHPSPAVATITATPRTPQSAPSPVPPAPSQPRTATEEAGSPGARRLRSLG